jgi:hypothetical protein
VTGAARLEAAAAAAAAAAISSAALLVCCCWACSLNTLLPNVSWLLLLL